MFRSIILAAFLITVNPQQALPAAPPPSQQKTVTTVMGYGKTVLEAISEASKNAKAVSSSYRQVSQTTRESGKDKFICIMTIEFPIKK